MAALQVREARVVVRSPDRTPSGAALAIFVKTPELSPVKTRLARGLGSDLAQQFYLRSVRAVESVARSLRDCASAYWAVAERSGLAHERWAALPIIEQGDGELGQRLHRVYSTLRERHGAVVLLGADCPQLTARALRQILELLQGPEDPIAIGRAHDGGFWLFAGRARIAEEVWISVDYSQAQTCADLQAALAGSGRIHQVDCMRDADELEDLAVVLAALDTLPEPTAEQVQLAQWLRANAARLKVPRD